MPVKISQLEIENIKRVKALSLEPAPDGLTIVGGRNEQGKTSVLDAIAWAVGGDRFKPSQPQREGSVTPPKLRVTLSNGLVVERKGPSSSLKVIDPHGNKGGQQLLNEFVEALALDLPRFMQSTSKEKAKTLLQVIGVGEQLYELEEKEQRLYNRRHEIGQIAEQKKAAAEEMPSHPEAPSEPVSASALINQQQEILAKNGENQRLRARVEDVRNAHKQKWEAIQELNEKLRAMEADLATLALELETAEKTAEQLTDESTAELEASIAAVDEINAKVRTNQAKSLLDDEANEYRSQYEGLTTEIEGVRAEKLALLEGADLPLSGLSVEAGELEYKGHPWDNLSGSEQLKVATAIVRRLNPECGFVLMDRLEQMDLDTLREFGEWLTSEGLQVIATRVSTGDECSVVIEDGYAVDAEKPAGWKAGEF
ncbi:MAG: AAA family ATPase [Coriobacteriia bacterium]